MSETICMIFSIALLAIVTFIFLSTAKVHIHRFIRIYKRLNRRQIAICSISTLIMIYAICLWGWCLYGVFTGRQAHASGSFSTFASLILDMFIWSLIVILAYYTIRNTVINIHKHIPTKQIIRTTAYYTILIIVMVWTHL